MKKLGIGLLAFLFLAALGAALLQTPWAKERAKEILLEALAKEGVSIEAGEVQGVIPNAFTIEKFQMETASYLLRAEKVRLQISLWRLLKKEIFLQTLAASHIVWTAKEEAPQVEKAMQTQLSSFSFSLRIQNLQLEDLRIASFPSFDVRGGVRLGKKGRSGAANLRFQQQGAEEKTAHLIASLAKNQKVEVYLSTEKFPVPYGTFSGSLFASGPLSAWLGEAKEISGKGEGTLGLLEGGPLVEGSWQVSTRFAKEADGSYRLFRTEAENPFFTLSLDARLSPDFSLESGDLSLTSTPDTFSSFSGQVQLTASCEKVDQALRGEAFWQVPSLSFKEAPLAFQSWTGSLKGVWENGALAAQFTSEGRMEEEPFTALGELSWEKGGPLLLSSYSFASPQLRFSGNLEWLQPDPLFRGSTQIAQGSLALLGIDSLFGTVEGGLDWGVETGQGAPLQTVQTALQATEVFYRDFFAEKASLEGAFLNPFEALRGEGSLQAEGVRWKMLSLDRLQLLMEAQGDVYPFSIAGQGAGVWPFRLFASGAWKEGELSLYGIEGSLLRHTVFLKAPVRYVYTEEGFALTPLGLQIDQAEALLEANQEKGERQVTVSLSRFPLDLLSINPLGFSVKGWIDGSTKWEEKKGAWTGGWDFAVAGFDIADTSPAILPKSGTWKGSYEKSHLLGEASFRQENGEPFFTTSFSLPVRLSLWPWELEPLWSTPAEGRLQFSGNVEEVFDFFDLGVHHLAGKCSADFSMGGTLAEPEISGKLSLEKGSYENYATGTEWTDVEAVLSGEKKLLRLASLQAHDGKRGGKLEAKGTLYLNRSDRFPFQGTLDFSDFRFVEMPLASAEGTGHLEIRGDLDSAFAQGEIVVSRGELTIPSKVPRLLPELAVSYKDKTKPLPAPPQKPLFAYPLNLDILLRAPQNVVIAGRGIVSEWGGDFRITGTPSALSTQGTLSLVRGEFSFSSRNFKLEEGSLSFGGVPNAPPRLNLVAQTEAKGVTVFAQLEGPLNNPQLTLRSNPPLPLSSVLSYLLFGQDISEINSFQALQLVNSAASISGESPDILEKSRRALGIDRMQILSVPKANEEGETIAVQVGKYITDGVLVTFSQGAEDNGVNIGIEVDLKHGFTFVLETQQQQEQGKFSLRWSLNY